MLELHRTVQLSLQPTAESCRSPGANVKGAAFHLRADPAAFSFYSSSSGMLLAYTPPHPPRYHSACMFLREQEPIFHVPVSSPSLSSFSCHQPTQPLGNGGVFFLPLAFFSSLNVRDHKPNLHKGKSCLCSPFLSCTRFSVLKAFIPLALSAWEMSNYLERTTIRAQYLKRKRGKKDDTFWQKN